jgi:hypothetical protein
MCKLMETLIKDQIVHFLADKDIDQLKLLTSWQACTTDPLASTPFCAPVILMFGISWPRMLCISAS